MFINNYTKVFFKNWLTGINLSLFWTGSWKIFSLSLSLIHLFILKYFWWIYLLLSIQEKLLSPSCGSSWTAGPTLTLPGGGTGRPWHDSWPHWGSTKRGPRSSSAFQVGTNTVSKIFIPYTITSVFMKYFIKYLDLSVDNLIKM